MNTNHFVGSSSDSNDNRVYSYRDVLRQCFNMEKLTTPSPLSSNVSIALVIIICLLLIVLDSLFVALEDKLAAADITSIVVCCVIFVITITTIVALQSQPSSAKRISFQVPLVPWVPFLSVFVNFYLMLKLSTMTWIRFSVWMFIVILYGIWNSNERIDRKNQPNIKYETKENSVAMNSMKN
ncbi:unnamed protein product, partial [Medioppia subpectinata]